MPIKPSPAINQAVMGLPEDAGISFSKVGIANGGGGVKVGRRVEVGMMGKAATKVGLSVSVSNGAGVGGGSTTGSRVLDGETVTLAAYTQAVPRGACGNSISTHSPAGERPTAAAVPPTGRVPTMG